MFGWVIIILICLVAVVRGARLIYRFNHDYKAARRFLDEAEREIGRHDIK